MKIKNSKHKNVLVEKIMKKFYENLSLQIVYISMDLIRTSRGYDDSESEWFGNDQEW